MLCKMFQVLGIEKERGTLQPGAIADLVLLDNDLNVQVHTTSAGAVTRCSICWYAHTLPCGGVGCLQATYLAGHLAFTRAGAASASSSGASSAAASVDSSSS